MSYTFSIPAHLAAYMPLAWALLGLLVGIAAAYLLGARALVETRGFLAESFTDARGRADGKLLTLALMAFCVAACYPVGWATGRWPPEYIWTLAHFFLGAGYGFSTFENRTKIKAEGDVAQAKATGLPVPGEVTQPAAAPQVSITNNAAPDGTE